MNSNGSRSVLFLAYSFPPAGNSACTRTWNIARFLARSGWRVTVVTPHTSLWKFTSEAEKTDSILQREGIQRILTGHRWRCLRPDHLKCRDVGLARLAGGICRRVARRLGIDPGTGWIHAAEEACSPLTGKDVDIILASGPPSVPFRLAKRLSDRLARPYVLDYHDPWTGNPHLSGITAAASEQEAKLLSGCTAVSIVTDSWAAAMQCRFRLGSKLHVIPSGYDPEAFRDIQPHGFGHPAIVYAGTFYPPKRVVSPLMAALKQLEYNTSGSDSEWCFHYYGVHSAHVMEEAQRYGVTHRIRLHGTVSQTEALSAVKAACAAVVITSISEESTNEDQGIVPLKLFDAVGLGTPVLVISSPGNDIEKIAPRTGLIRIFPGRDIEGMASFLRDAVAGQVPARGNPEIYAWDNVLKRLDLILHQAIENRSMTDGAMPLAGSSAAHVFRATCFL